MKIAAIVLALCVALPLAAADDREVKEQLVAEVLELIDLRKLAEANLTLHAGQETEGLRERVLARLDYAKLGAELYAPIFRDEFTVDELKELRAFYRTKAGQKSAGILTTLANAMLMGSSAYLDEQVREVHDELAREKRKDRPYLATMEDLRHIATSLESRATDTNEYPKVAFADLPPLLEPTYVMALPRVDAWGTPFAYASDGTSYRLVSAGADKKFEWQSRQLDPREKESRPVESLDADIIFQNGGFIQFPKRAASEQ
jgi:hypothetical protein